MRGAALLALTLVGCASTHGPLDVITPDEFTFGHGSSTSALDGKMDARGEDSWPSTYDGESESTYMALTWDLPTWEGKEGGMDRGTQRNLSLLIDQMVEDEIEEEEESPGLTADGVPPPPPWLPYAFGGAILLFLAFMGIKSRGNGWH